MTTRLDPQLTRAWLAGQQAANRFTQAERRARLQAMTVAEALRVYGELCDLWDRQPPPEGDWERLEQQRLAHKINLRRAFERLAQARSSA